MTRVIVIVRDGVAMRVLLVRRDTRRRAHIARAMQRAGHPSWDIRRVTRMTARALDRVLAGPATGGLWGVALAASIRRELQKESV